jgi:hypothetical protein
VTYRHRPAYSSYESALNLILPPVDSTFVPEIEPLLLNAKVRFQGLKKLLPKG